METRCLASRVLAWYASQDTQTDVIEYERSFIATMDQIQISQAVFRAAVEEAELSKKKKDSSNSLR